LYVDSGREDLLEETSPSALDEIDYRGVETHQLRDRRAGDNVNWIDHPYHTYHIAYADEDTMAMYVNVDIDKETADAIVFEVSYFYGQLPLILRKPLNFVTVHPGNRNILLSPDGYMFHLGYYQQSNGSMQHFLVHEIAHISLDWAQALNFPGTGNKTLYYEHSNNPIAESTWLEAARLDGGFITQYARNNPFVGPDPDNGYEGGEDMADTLVFYIASRISTERYHPKLRALWETALGHRFAILDTLDFSIPPRGRLSQ